MRAHHIKTLSFSDLHKRMVLITFTQLPFSMLNRIRLEKVKPEEGGLFQLQNTLCGDREMLDLYNLMVLAKSDVTDLTLPWGEYDNTRAVPVQLYPEISSKLRDYRIRIFKVATPIAETLDPSDRSVFEQMRQLECYTQPIPDTFDPLDSEDIACLSDTYHDFQVIAMEAVWKRLKDRFDVVDRLISEGAIEGKSVSYKQITLTNLMEAASHASNCNFLEDPELDHVIEAIHTVYGDIERFNDIRRFDSLRSTVILGTLEIGQLFEEGIKKYQ